MYQESEVITLLLTTGLGFFLWMNQQALRHLYHWKLLFLCYLCYLSGSWATVLEGYIWANALNLLEHISYLVFSILLLLWCWRVGFRKENNQ